MLAEARARFTEGVAHTQEARWEDAIASFRAALELHPAPTIRYNLAAALVELRRYHEATIELAPVLVAEDVPPNIAELSAALVARIDRESGRLTVETTEAAQGATLTLDGQPLDPAWLAQEIRVAPGPHTVIATRDGADIAEAEVVVAAGTSARVRLGSGPGIAPIEPAPVAPSEPGVPLHEDWRLWVGVGAGVAAILIAIAVAVAVSSATPEAAVPGNFSPAVITWP